MEHSLLFSHPPLPPTAPALPDLTPHTIAPSVYPATPVRTALKSASMEAPPTPSHPYKPLPIAPAPPDLTPLPIVAAVFPVTRDLPVKP